jgi:pyruvate dehydrogenase E2 component (dihydrolipoamide acetyltransferase)
LKALKKHGNMNSHFLGETVRNFHTVHLGIAVDAPRGLMVPTLRNADRMNLEELAINLKELAAKAQKGDIDPELLSGATFTVTNLGALGVEMFTPVLNPPQVGILGINAIRHRPEDIGNGIIGFIPVIGLSLTFDHRAVDGAPAALFLKEVADQIKNFEIN